MRELFPTQPKTINEKTVLGNYIIKLSKK